MKIKAIAFDKDGTFVDFMATWGPAIEHAMRVLSAGNPAAFSRLCAVNRYDPVSRRLDPDSPFIAEASVDFAGRWAGALRLPFSADFHRRMDQLLDEGALAHVAPIGDPARVFSQLKSDGYRLGIITNDTERGARLQIGKLGLSAYFQTVFGYDSGHGRKPAPDPLLAFARHCGLSPAEIAMVGDTLHDLHAGRAAGAMTIAVTTGFAGAGELAPHADHVVADIMAIPALLASL
jgi:phosphoglycolate phosphatase